MDEFYGRAMPAPPAVVPEERFVALAQLYGRYALVLDERRRGVRARSGLVVGDGPRAGDRAAAERERVVPRRRGGARREVRGRTVREMVEAAREAGGEVLLPNELGIEVPGAYRYAVHVVAGITHTIGGLRVDARARVLATRTARRSTACTPRARRGGICDGRLRERPRAGARASAAIAAETAAADAAR